MERKRNRLEVIRDILEVIRSKVNGAKPTQILYKSNLSHSMMKDYLDELIQKKLVHFEETEKGKCYKITSGGQKYLEQFSVIRDFMDSFGLA